MGREDKQVKHYVTTSHCEPLSENLAFYENRDKTGSRCTNVQLCSRKKRKRSVAWFRSYRAKCVADVEHKFTRKCNVLCCYGKF